MHPLRQATVAGLISLFFTSAQPMPATPASDASAAIDDVEDEAAIVASQRWRDLVTRLHDDALRGPANESRMRAACRIGLARPRAAGVSAADACLATALASFDMHARYFPASETAAHRRDTQRDWVGIGLEVGLKQPQEPLRVAMPAPGAAGERAGIRAGDLIVRIDGQDLAPLSTEDAIALIRGPAGSLIRLDVERGPTRDKLTISARRERVHVPTVQLEGRLSPVAGLRFMQFATDMRQDLAAEVDIIRHTRPTPSGALIVDLRSSQGGVLEAMVQVAAAFSSDDTVVAHLLTRQGDAALTAATSKDAPTAFPAAARDWLVHARIAVLVDEHTTNAAEAFALFLREQRGARILGVRTAGVASVEQILPLGDDASMRVRTGELRSSMRASWEGGGIVADTVLPPSPPGAPVANYGSAKDPAFSAALQLLEAP